MPTLRNATLRTMLTEAGLVTAREVDLCLEDLASGDAVGTGLVDLLLDRGLVTTGQASRLLRDLARHRVTCPGCGRDHPADGVPDDREAFPCCGATPPADGSLEVVEGTAGGSAESPDPASSGGAPLVGRELGGYRLERVIGRGGMGTVYEGVDGAGEERRAIKVLSAEAARTRTRAVERFVREARILEGIRHPNVVRVDGVGRTEGNRFIVMEYLPGPGLEVIARDREGFDLERTLDLMEGVLEGLGVAHEHGVVHRDVKPENIRLGADGRPKLTDFGLARGSAGDQSLTQTGEILGTPFWMSPEQGESDGRSLDARSDIYSLGATFHYLLTGRLPFRGNTALEVILKHRSEVPPSPTSIEPRVPPAISQIVAKMMEKEPARRHASAEEVLADLRAVREGEVADELGTIEIDCVCGSRLEFLESEAGRMRDCHHCGQAVWVPRPGEASEEEQELAGDGEGSPRRFLRLPKMSEMYLARVAVVNGFCEPEPALEVVRAWRRGESRGAFLDRLVADGVVGRKDLKAILRQKGHRYREKEDAIFARITAHAGLVPTDVLGRLREEARDRGERLGDVLIEEGHLEPADRDRVDAARRRYRRDRRDLLSARIAVGAGHLTKDEAAGLLLELESGSVYGRPGEMPRETFVERAAREGLLAPEEVEGVLDGATRYLLRKRLPDLPIPGLEAPGPDQGEPSAPDLDLDLGPS